jgi:hypothetical protein
MRETERFHGRQRSIQPLSLAVILGLILSLVALLPRVSDTASAALESLTIATSGHLVGAGGTNWRTDLEVHNPGKTPASYSLALLRRDASNSMPSTGVYSIGPGQSVRWVDVIDSAFGATGAAAVRVVPLSTPLLVTSRTYNLIGAGNTLGLPVGSTFGQFVPVGAESEAFTSTQQARLIQLAHDRSGTSGYRTNIGLVNAGASTIAISIALHTSSGAKLGTANETLRPYEFKQIDKIFERVTTSLVADGYAIVQTSTSGGRFYTYASVVDNRTGDPIYVPAQPISLGPTTVTLQPAPGTNTGSDRGSPSAGMDAYVWKATPATNYGSAVALALNDNQGTGCYNDNSTAYGFIRFDVNSALMPTVATSAKIRLYCMMARTSPAGSLPLQLYRLASDWNEMTVTYNARPSRGPLVAQVNVPDEPNGIGWHELDITSLYNQWRSGAVPNYGLELYVSTCKANNTHDRQFASSDDSTNTWRRPMLVVTGTGASAAPPQYGQAAASEPIFVPTSAHSTGTAGTNWRTDLEVHNPGSTQATFAVSLLKRDTDNASPTTVSYTLAPGVSARYTDAVATLFSYDKAAALRITPTVGKVLVTSRTYNLMVAGNPLRLPPGATFGQFVPGLSESKAISPVDHGRIIQLSHTSSTTTGFRTNIGFVNAGAAAMKVNIRLLNWSGATLGNQSYDLRAYEYKQVDKIFEKVTSTNVDDGYAIISTPTSGGSFFAYASVIDNRTGDPIFVPAIRVAGPPPTSTTPTPTPTPTPQPGNVISGPSGTSVALPSGGRSPSTTVTITAGSSAQLAKTGETPVSPVIAINVSGAGVITGDGPFLVRIPVSATVSDPSKLLLKVRTTVGPVYPVAGVYNATTKVFTAELQKLWSGWNMGVVSSPGLTIVTPAPPESNGVRPLGWVTPDDWRTCSWTLDVQVDPRIPPAFPNQVNAELVKACEHLRGAQFRSPKLWIDSRSGTRKVHIVVGTGRNDPSTSFCGIDAENSPDFSMVGYTDAQMQSLGQIYINWDNYQSFLPNGGSLGNMVIHELYHAVQTGYDYRDKWWNGADGKSNHSAMWLMEGAATLLGTTYQHNPNGIYGGDVALRWWRAPEKLDASVQVTDATGYDRQDFFAYIAKRYNGGSFRDQRHLFQNMADQTDGQFDKTNEEYFTFYRRAMDLHYSGAFKVTLPELYTEFVLDRAYRHGDAALLRDADKALPKSSLDKKVFAHLTAWSPASKAKVTAATDGNLPSGVLPLQTWAISATVPDSSRSAGTFPLTFEVSGAPVARDGVRIFIFRESGGVMVAGGELEVTNISTPVAVPVSASTQTVTILVLNTSVEHRTAQASVSWKGVAVTVLPASAAVLRGATQQFSATVTGTTNTKVTWRVQEGAVGGSISASGLYTAGSTLGNYNVVATSQADPTKAAIATVAVVPTADLTVTPRSAGLFAGQSAQFTATMSGARVDVTWSLVDKNGNPVTGAGTLTQNGLYTAPAENKALSAYVKAVSKAEPSKSYAASVGVWEVTGVWFTVHDLKASFSSTSGGFNNEDFSLLLPGGSNWGLSKVPLKVMVQVHGEGVSLVKTWNHTDERGWRRAGNLTVAFSATGANLKAVTGFSGKQENDYGSGPYKDEVAGLGGQIPRVPDTDSFVVEGADACKILTTLRQEWSITWPAPNSGYLSQYSCKANSRRGLSTSLS